LSLDWFEANLSILFSFWPNSTLEEFSRASVFLKEEETWSEITKFGFVDGFRLLGEGRITLCLFTKFDCIEVSVFEYLGVKLLTFDGSILMAVDLADSKFGVSNVVAGTFKWLISILNSLSREPRFEGKILSFNERSSEL